MSTPNRRQMSMIAFLQAQNCSNLPGSWRYPSSMTDFLTPDYFQRIARVLEDGKFHMAFFDDRLAMPDIYSNDHAQTVELEEIVAIADLVRELDRVAHAGAAAAAHAQAQRAVGCAAPDEGLLGHLDGLGGEAHAGLRVAVAPVARGERDVLVRVAGLTGRFARG